MMMYSRRRLKQFGLFCPCVRWMGQFCRYEIALILNTCGCRIHRLLTPLCLIVDWQILGISSNHYRMFTTVLKGLKLNFFRFSERIHVCFISLPLSDILVQFATQSMNSTFLFWKLSGALFGVKLLILAIFIFHFNLFFTLNPIHGWVWFCVRVQIFVNCSWDFNFSQFCSILIHKLFLTPIFRPRTLNSYDSRIHQWILVRNSSILVFIWPIHGLFIKDSFKILVWYMEWRFSTLLVLLVPS